MAGETILIIDDSNELRALLESILNDSGYTTLSASTAQESLALLSARQPDAILIDLELPDMNGIKVLQELNRQGMTIPMIMMTAYGSEGTAARALKLGARDYLIKPFTMEEILSSIEQALADRRIYRERDQLKATLKEHSRQFTLLAAVGHFVTSTPDRDLALQRIVEAGLYATQADAGLLLLLDDAAERLRVAVARGKAGHTDNYVPRLAGDEGLQPVLQSQVAIRLCSDLTPGIQLQTGEAVQAVLQVPIQGQGRSLGILSVDRRGEKRSFSNHDELLLKILASYAALALERRSP